VILWYSFSSVGFGQIKNHYNVSPQKTPNKQKTEKYLKIEISSTVHDVLKNVDLGMILLW
jgi:hypothetical protein